MEPLLVRCATQNGFDVRFRTELVGAERGRRRLCLHGARRLGRHVVPDPDAVPLRGRRRAQRGGAHVRLPLPDGAAGRRGLQHPGAGGPEPPHDAEPARAAALDHERRAAHALRARADHAHGAAVDRVAGGGVQPRHGRGPVRRPDADEPRAGRLRARADRRRRRGLRDRAPGPVGDPRLRGRALRRRAPRRLPARRRRPPPPAVPRARQQHVHPGRLQPGLEGGYVARGLAGPGAA